MAPFTDRRDRGSGWGGDLALGRDRRNEHDTVADDCVTTFLGAVEEALWVLTDTQRAPACAFGNAARRREHVRELRRLLDRLHEVLLRWQEAPP